MRAHATTYELIPTVPDEQSLIREAQRGHLPAFNQLVLAYQELAFDIAYRVLGEANAPAGHHRHLVAAGEGAGRDPIGARVELGGCRQHEHEVLGNRGRSARGP